MIQIVLIKGVITTHTLGFGSFKTCVLISCDSIVDKRECVRYVTMFMFLVLIFYFHFIGVTEN